MSEVVVKCPICGDPPKTHNHLHLNPEKRKYHCFWCNAGGTFDYLVWRYPEMREVIQMIAGIRLPIGRHEFEKRTYDFYSVSGSDSILGGEARKYLLKRGLTEEEIRLFGVQISPQMPHRVIFPDLSGGVSVFWVARAVRSARPPWLFPRTGETMQSKSEALWGLKFQKRESEIWITEGIFDAIAVGGVAVFGKVVSGPQMRKIFQLNPQRLVIGFDNEKDAREKARALQRLVRAIVPTAIQHPPVKHNDYGEMLGQGWRREND